MANGSMIVGWMVGAVPMLIAGAPPAVARPTAAQDAPLVKLIEDQAKAVTAFDQRALAALTAPDYREISPVGDVDERAAMLGFYAPANKVPAPAVDVGEVDVRRFGDMAVMSARITYTMAAAPGIAAPPPRALRAGYVARRYGPAWKLVSAQFTPIRGAPAGAKPLR